MKLDLVHCNIIYPKIWNLTMKCDGNLPRQSSIISCNFSSGDDAMSNRRSGKLIRGSNLFAEKNTLLYFVNSFRY